MMTSLNNDVQVYTIYSSRFSFTQIKFIYIQFTNECIVLMIYTIDILKKILYCSFTIFLYFVFLQYCYQVEWENT